MKKKHFSLIELLIVIAIIAVLMGIAFPVYNGIQQRAKKTKARAEMNSIETAIKSYEMTYGILPLPDSSTSIISSDPNYATLFTYLTNVRTDRAASGVSGNGRGIRFLDVPSDYASNGFQDPWNGDFTVYVDTDYDGIIVGPDINNESSTTTLYGTVFITANPNGVESDTIYSWN